MASVATNYGDQSPFTHTLSETLRRRAASVIEMSDLQVIG